MSNVLDWGSNRSMWIRVLEKQTGKGLTHWNNRIRGEVFHDKDELRTWLAAHGISGYAANLLIMERFGYPDFITASADDLIQAQYEDRAHLKSIYDAIITAVYEIGEFTIQARKTYVSLLTPHRTFARMKPTTKNRLDVGLRLEDQVSTGRLLPSRIHQSMRHQLSFTSVDDLDNEAIGWLRLAYEENCK